MRRRFFTSHACTPLPRAAAPSVTRVPRVTPSQVITNRLNVIKEQSHAMRACEWANSKMRTDITQKQLQETKAIAQELEQANAVLLTERKTRLKEFLAAEAAVFERQLNEMGKAFCKNR